MSWFSGGWRGPTYIHILILMCYTKWVLLVGYLHWRWHTMQSLVPSFKDIQKHLNLCIIFGPFISILYVTTWKAQNAFRISVPSCPGTLGQSYWKKVDLSASEWQLVCRVEFRRGSGPSDHGAKLSLEMFKAAMKLHFHVWVLGSEWQGGAPFCVMIESLPQLEFEWVELENKQRISAESAALQTLLRTVVVKQSLKVKLSLPLTSLSMFPPSSTGRQVISEWLGRQPQKAKHANLSVLKVAVAFPKSLQMMWCEISAILVKTFLWYRKMWLK